MENYNLEGAAECGVAGGDFSPDYHRILKHVLDVVFVIDEQEMIRFVSPACPSLFGYLPEEMTGFPFTRFVYPDDLESSTPSHYPLSPSTQTLHFENRYVRKNGSVVTIDWSANWVEEERLFYCVAREGSEKTKLQERYKALVQKGTDLVTIIDENCFFLFVSDSVSTILGYTPAELLSKNSKAFVHPDDVPKAAQEHDQIVGKQVPGCVRHRFRHKNGHWVWLEAMATNHLDNPNIEGVVVVSRNIDEQVKLQQKLDQERVNKQKEITSAIIRAQETERSQIGLELHDNVNQMLTTVKLYNELFLTGTVQDPELLVKSIRYLQQCINEIRSVSKRLSMPTLGKISLQESVQELADSINAMGSLKVRCCLEAIPPEVISEDLHLAVYRIIQESLNNILKYAGADQVFIAIGYERQQLSLLIEDNGVGFNLNAKSPGIGMMNIRTRAEQLNASFAIETAPGNGCKIKISFPLQQA